MSIVLLSPMAALAAEQVTQPGKTDASAADAPLADQQAVITPDTTVETKLEDIPTLKDAEVEAAAEAASSGTSVDPEDVLVPGNAASQGDTSRAKEAERDCADSTTRPTTSKMLGDAGTVLKEDAGSLGMVLLLVAASAALLVIVVLVVRGAPASKDRLQLLATVVAIASGAAGLVVTFVPGVKGSDRPAEEATVKVREVHPRITLAEFGARTGTDVDDAGKTDLLEIGNVIWLEIVLRGYAGKDARLQYGLYRQRDEVLLDNTGRSVPLRVADADAQTSFVPIWVGYPTGERFHAQFRLLVDGRVRQLAKTGGMKGSTKRYSCSSTKA